MLDRISFGISGWGTHTGRRIVTPTLALVPLSNMNNHYDYKRYAVLYVDDEEMALKYFEKTFGQDFRVMVATNATDGLKLIEQHGDDVGVLLTDQRMPGQKGVQLLERARQLRPRMVRMLITAYADFGVTVDAVNLGSIFRYISKPLQVEDMRNTLQRAVEYYILQRERDDLLREKLSVLQNMVITDRVISLGVLAAGLSEHLRNPLEAVQTFLNLAPSKLREEAVNMDRLRDPAFWREFHSRVVLQAERISAMVGELNDAAVPDADSLEKDIDPATIIGSVAKRYEPQFAAKGVAIKNRVTAELPKLRLDPAKFERLFDLLLAEELAILQGGMTLNLAAKVKNLGNEPVSIEIQVSDDGPGIPNEALRSVFDPFYIRVEDEQQNVALNLMGVFFLVYHYGGSIETKNLPGTGVTMVIELPVVRRDIQNPTASSRDFVTKVLMNDALWERLLAGE